MKLISLNTWGGRILQPLLDFIKKHSEDTDIFCFQEIFRTTSKVKEDAGFRINLYSELEKILINHTGYFVSSMDNYIVGSFAKSFTNYNLSSGLAIFINKKINITSHEDFFVFRKKNDYQIDNYNTMPRVVQSIKFIQNSTEFTICNVHGIWVDTGKGDTPQRLKQSKMIKNFLDKQKGEKILCGDFNLSIDTKSLEILEENLINLIKKFNIETTRNQHFPGQEKNADYTFVSQDVIVKNFQVPNIEISDHLPIILEFS